MEQVALLAQQNTLPEPTLDIGLGYNTAPSSDLGYGQPSSGDPTSLRSSPAVAPPSDDPWTTGRFGVGTSSPHTFGDLNGGAPSSVAGSGLPSGWWKRQEKVKIQFGGQQGFVLNRYMVYSITTEVRHIPKLSKHNYNFSEQTSARRHSAATVLGIRVPVGLPSSPLSIPLVAATASQAHWT